MDLLFFLWRCNLASVMLQLLALGIPDVLNFDFMSKPSPGETKYISLKPFKTFCWHVTQYSCIKWHIFDWEYLTTCGFSLSLYHMMRFEVVLPCIYTVYFRCMAPCVFDNVWLGYKVKCWDGLVWLGLYRVHAHGSWAVGNSWGCGAKGWQGDTDSTGQEDG